MKENSTFTKIRLIVAKIPKGKVSTYGAVARAAGLKDARVVGWAIYGNQDPNIPCHRVVNKQGGLAKQFSLGGIEEHASRLEADGIKVVNGKVDLKKYEHHFKGM